MLLQLSPTFYPVDLYLPNLVADFIENMSASLSSATLESKVFTTIITHLGGIFLGAMESTLQRGDPDDNKEKAKVNLDLMYTAFHPQVPGRPEISDEVLYLDESRCLDIHANTILHGDETRLQYFRTLSLAMKACVTQDHSPNIKCVEFHVHVSWC